MIDVVKIEKLMDLMAKHGFDVVQAESSVEKITLARNVAQASLFQPQTNGFSNSASVNMATPSVTNKTTISLENSAENQVQTTPKAPVENTVSAQKLPEGVTITSPFVGTFYRAPNPESPMFVELGSRIKKGQTLCIVEAMKLMNEIEAEIEGEIVAILVENAKPVEFGTPLFIVAQAK